MASLASRKTALVMVASFPAHDATAQPTGAVRTKQGSMRILGIESSCDETAAAIVADGRDIHANVVASQASIHQQYGGVVPEVASRQQLAAIIPVVESAMEAAGTGWDGIDAIAATYGPGLAGSLLVGLTAGKALALARGLPFLGVNHLEAHIYANWLRTASDPVRDAPSPHDEHSADPQFPLLALVISGAHSELVYLPHHGRYQLIGQTRDDAAGEAFDKVARVLGLGYPGGPAIEHAAAHASAGAHNPYHLPRAWLPGTYDFSFSGLKTAVIQTTEGAQTRTAAPGTSRYARAAAMQPALDVPALAGAFQQAVVDVLARKTVRAAQQFGAHTVVLAGGVAANLALRARLEAALTAAGSVLRSPPIAYCTDNAAMVASAAYFHLRLGERSGLDLDVSPGLQLPFAAPE